MTRCLSVRQSDDFSNKQRPSLLSLAAQLLSSFPDFFCYEPADTDGGCGAGVAHSLDGETLWVVHRGPRVWDGRTYAPPDGERLSEATLKEGPIAVPTVVQLQKETGRVMRAWGQGTLYLPHSVVTDRDGNVWVTDTGLHQARCCAPPRTHAVQSIRLQ